MQKEIFLDGEAEKLFQELGGIDHRNRVLSSDHSVYQQKEISDDDVRFDSWRTLLIEWLHLVTSYFTDVRLSQGIKAKKDSFIQIAKLLYKLSLMPGRLDRSILIRYRGVPTGVKVPAKADYVILYGNIRIDSASGISMVKRMGIQMSHIPARLVKSFNTLSDYGINTIYLELPSLFPSSDLNDNERREANKALEKIQICFDIISRYHAALKADAPILFHKNGKEVSLPLVRDEKGNNDINLTLLAGLNNIKPELMQSLIQKVDSRIQSDSAELGIHHTSIYNAIFNIEKLKEKLIKPPVEVNNVKWMIMERDQAMVSKERIQIARMVMEHFGDSPEKAGQIIQTVYGNDYNRINSGHLGKRIHLASALLNSAEKSQGDQNIENEVIDNIKGRFNQVRDEVFDDLVLQDNMLKIRAGEKEKIIGNVNEKLKEMLSFYKGRSETRKKMKKMSQGSMDFASEDYDTIANDFDISADAAKNLITLLKSCFDDKGHFIRKIFERNIPEFVRYEAKIFDFMWHYLKETFHRSDRVAFLNSLQLLIARMKQPVRAIRILLTDILKDTYIVNYSDRNAFMLASLMLRKYNKELNLDIEITPEEVLLVKEGLVQDVVTAARNMIDAVQDKVSEKGKTIHTRLTEALDPGKSDIPPMPVRYIFSLEREMYIFLSLVGGKTAYALIRKGLEEYGNPASEIYRLKATPEYIGTLLQHLNIVIRTVGRVGSQDELSLLDRVSWGEKEFLRLSEGGRNEDKVRRLMKWIDTSKVNILKKSWKDTGEPNGFEVLPPVVPPY